MSLDDTMWSDMWFCFSELTGTSGSHIPSHLELSPLQHVKFSPWRRLGFAIGDYARLAKYGLMVPRTDYSMGKLIPYFEAWRSVMTQDERDAVEAEIKRLDALP